MNTQTLPSYIKLISLNLLIALLAPSAMAAIVMGTISGYSEIDRAQTNRITIYGGTAGAANAGQCASASSARPCNNCTSDITPCNNQRIFPSLELSFQFTSTTGRPGYAMIVNSDNEVIDQSTQLQNIEYSLTTTWTKICSAIGAGPGCDTFARKKLYIAIGSNVDDTVSEKFSLEIIVQPIPDSKRYHTNCDEFKDPESDEGLCNFRVQAGDQKVYITNPQGDSVLSGPNSVEYANVRFYYGTDGFASANPSASYHDLRVTEPQAGDFNFVENIIPGLSNGVTYFFRMANVDRAGNVFYFSSAPNDQTPANNPFLDEEKHSAIPDEVFGILDEDLSCFIATAAYGSPFQEKVADLRKFRDQFLKSNPVGQFLVNQYYRFSPPLAQWIAKSEVRRKIVRVALWPVWGMAKVSLWLQKNLFPKAQAQDFLDEELEDVFADDSDLKGSDSQPSSSRQIEPAAPLAPAPPIGPRTQRMKHPDAKRGLVRINRDGTYVYRTEKSTESSTASVYLGALPPPAIQSGDGTNFSDVYGGGNLISLWGDYEWPFISRFGKLGLKFGTGLFMASGQGRFRNGESALEMFNFIVVPTTLSVSYRMQLGQTPWIVPRIEGGGGLFNIAEIRDDAGKVNFAYSPVTTFSAGLLFSLSAWSNQAAYRLDNDYGINNVWLDLGIRSIISVTKDIDFTSTLLVGGLVIDY